MTTTSRNRKLRLIEKIVQTKDEKALEQMEVVFDSLQQAETLPPAVRAGALEALAQGRADRAAGRVVSHEEFMQAVEEEN